MKCISRGLAALRSWNENANLLPSFPESSVRAHYAMQALCVAIMEDGSVGAQSDSSSCEQLDATSRENTKTKNSSSKATVSKGTDEYLRKRARNNEAVRKSRVKSRMRIEDTQRRVDLLAQENSDLKTKVTLLTKELNVLRSLFANGAVTLPEHAAAEETVEVHVKTEPINTANNMDAN